MDQETNQRSANTTPIIPSPQPPITPANSQTLTKQSSVNYFTRLFSGRVNRRNYIIGTLLPTFILILLQIVLIIINELIVGKITNLQIRPGESVPAIPQVPLGVRIFDSIAILICIFVTLYILIYTFSLVIRRLHDLNKSGWLLWVIFIPFVGFFLEIYIIFFPGTKGDNKYGVQPLPKINIIQDILRFSQK